MMQLQQVLTVAGPLEARLRNTPTTGQPLFDGNGQIIWASGPDTNARIGQIVFERVSEAISACAVGEGRLYTRLESCLNTATINILTQYPEVKPAEARRIAFEMIWRGINLLLRWIPPGLQATMEALANFAHRTAG